MHPNCKEISLLKCFEKSNGSKMTKSLSGNGGGQKICHKESHTGLHTAGSSGAGETGGTYTTQGQSSGASIMVPPLQVYYISVIYSVHTEIVHNLLHSYCGILKIRWVGWGANFCGLIVF